MQSEENHNESAPDRQALGSKKEFLEIFGSTKSIDELLSFLTSNAPAKIGIGGLAGSGLSFVITAIGNKLSGTHLIVLSGKRRRLMFTMT